MAPSRIAGPLGAYGNQPSVDQGTLCRAVSAPPGLINWTSTTAAPPVPGNRKSDKSSKPTFEIKPYLEAMGKTGAPESVQKRIALAADFFEKHFPGKSQTQRVDYLKGIDFSKEVRVMALAGIAPVGALLLQHAVGNRPGNFFTKPGVGMDRLGIAQGNRQLKKFRVASGGRQVLVCTTAGISDTWTPGRTLNVYTPSPGRAKGQPAGRAGELVGGGGIQIVIPDPISYSVKEAT